jgi:PBP1b-binding outer membrane lipoprotein LpoB
MQMKQQKLLSLAAATLGIALFIGGCGEKKGDEAPQSSQAPAPAPMSEKAQGQKSEEKTESSKKG